MPASTPFKSPTIGTCASRILPISAGSMSMWMTSACGANSESLPVTRSEKRAPAAMMRSHSVMAMLANFEPCMPTGPRFIGCDAGNAPLPMSVVTTGICMSVESFTSSSVAFEAIAPPPT